MRVAYVTLIVALCTVLLAGLSHPSAPADTGLETGASKAPATRPALGALYLHPIGCNRELWCIEGDADPCLLPPGVEGEPSLRLHNGSRWFVTVQETDEPADSDGSARRRLVCMRQDGLSVRLKTDPDFDPGPFIVRWPRHADDGRISCIARRLAGDGGIRDAGIYTLDLQFDEEGDITGLVGAPRIAVRTDLVRDGGLDWGGGLVPDACGHDWSPDGRQLVLESLHQRLEVIDLTSGQHRLLAGQGCDPVWSPCGSTIAYKVMEPFGAIVTADPDGKGMRGAAVASPQCYIVCRPVFSPDGRCLAHSRFVRNTRPSATWNDCTDTWVASLEDDVVQQRVLEASGGLVPVAWR